MLYSGVKFDTVVNELNGEVNIALPISNEMFCTHINALEQLIYTDFVKEQKAVELITNGSSSIPMTDITPASDEQTPVFEDIMKVYGGIFDSRTEYTKGSAVSGKVFYSKPLYWKEGISLRFNTVRGMIPDTIEVIYYVRPKLKTPDNMTILDVMLPIEFMPMVYAYLRCEMYKLAVNVTSSAQWANEYNAWLETFTQWIAERNNYFGE